MKWWYIKGASRLSQLLALYVESSYIVNVAFLTGGNKIIIFKKKKKKKKALTL